MNRARIFSSSFASRTHQRGVVMVEAAIVLPVLLLLLFATAELGRLFYSYNTVNKLAREGARYISNNAFTGEIPVVDLSAERRQATQRYVVYGNAATASGDPVLEHLTPDDVTVTTSGGNFVTVTIDYAQVPIFGGLLPTFGFGNGDIDVSFPLQATVTMRAIN